MRRHCSSTAWRARPSPSLTAHRPPAALLAALAAVVLPALGGAALALFGHAPGWLLPVGLMLPAGLAAVAARVYGTVLLARGDYRELSLQGAWRLALALGLASLSLHLLPAAAAVAVALLATELHRWRSARRCAQSEPSTSGMAPAQTGQ